MYLPATQPCTVTSTTSYRVPTGYWLHSLVHLLQQLVTECTDRLPAKQPCTGYSMFTALYSSLNWLQCTGYTALYTGFKNWLQSVPAGTGYTACTLTSTTGYSMYRPATGFTALYSSLNWLQCTGYTALYTGFNNWLQSVPAGTGYTALYTCFSNWLQSVPAGTGYTALYTCFILWVTSLLTGCWLHSPYCTVLQPNWFIIKKKKKKKKKSWLNIDQ